ncbi:hypothetical protein [Candidatus Poriferisocius sp.]|uniref:hypothetical protein n=1 Tax=Candidatus Poriferisocius sp. TaxID=3101276 RepID=UPI003B01A8B0
MESETLTRGNASATPALNSEMPYHGCHYCYYKAHHRNWTVEHHHDTSRPYLRPPGNNPPEPPPRC